MNFLKRLRTRLTGKAYATYSGVWTEITKDVDVFGKTMKCSLPINKDGTVDFTPEDIAGMSLKCPWCSEVIRVGDPVTLLTPIDPEFEIPEHCGVYSTDPLQLVGCLLWDCPGAHFGDRSGFWLPNTDEPEKKEGKVFRVMSPLEQLQLQMQNGDDSPVIVGDLSDPRKAMRTQQSVLKKYSDS